MPSVWADVVRADVVPGPQPRNPQDGTVVFESLATLADAAPVLLAFIDENGKGAWCNRAWREVTGRPLADEEGEGWLAAVHPDDRLQLRALTRNAAPFQLEVRLRGWDGPYRRLFVRASPRSGAGEAFTGHVVAATDLTDQCGLAEALQRSLLPEGLPDVPGALFCTRYRPGGTADFGGDWYDVIPLRNRRHGVAIGDVVGHGMRAAAVMGQLRQALRVYAAEGYSAAAVVERLNRFVFEQGPIEMATLCYGVLDADAATFDFASAGHLPPLRIPAESAPRYAETRPSPPIGAEAHTHYVSTMLHLEPGERLLLYTDGLVERRGESLDVGLARLASCAAASSTELNACCDALLDELPGPGRADDVVVLGMRITGVRRDPIRLRRPARASELGSVRRTLVDWLQVSGVPSEEAAVIALAVSEAATNAIEHAYGAEDGWFELDAEIDAGTLTVTVRDSGKWRPKARGGGGRGLGLIDRLMDEFQVRRGDTGTEVWMRRVVAREPSPS
jgi:anti-sigma regulatory factor (Ser/Thr protein kinase)